MIQQKIAVLRCTILGNSCPHLDQARPQEFVHDPDHDRLPRIVKIRAEVNKPALHPDHLATFLSNGQEDPYPTKSLICGTYQYYSLSRLLLSLSEPRPCYLDVDHALFTQVTGCLFEIFSSIPWIGSRPGTWGGMQGSWQGKISVLGPDPRLVSNRLNCFAA